MATTPKNDDRRSEAANVLMSIARGNPPSAADLERLHAYDDSVPRDGLELQLSVLELWRAASEEIGGWKIAWTSRQARDRGGPGFRPFGFVLASRMFQSGASLDAHMVPNGVLEPEICLILGKRLAGPNVTVEEARYAVSGVAPAFEICSQRMPPDLSIAVRIGNDMNNWGMVVGPVRSPDLALDGLSVELAQNDQVIATGSSSADVIDDPYLSLARVCRELDGVGLALEPGHVVLTGSVAASARMSTRGLVEGRFGPLGSVRLHVS